MYKNKNRVLKKWTWSMRVLALGVLLFIGGMVVGKAEAFFGAARVENAPTDVEWAQAKGFLPKEVKQEVAITQAEFVKIVMEEYGDTQENPLFFVKKMENHWARPYYSAAKSHGLIPCSCVIKPDEPMTLAEAAELVMYAVNDKANENVVGIQNVQEWTGRTDITGVKPVTYVEAAKMIREMDAEITAIKAKQGGL